MKCLIEEIHYIDIPVRDLQRSLDWYQKHLGFEPGFKNESMVIMKLPNGPVLALNQSDSSTRAVWSNEGMTRPIIGFTTNEIEQLHTNLRDAGITVTDIRDEGIGWFCEFLDPDGNMFSVLKYNHI